MYLPLNTGALLQETSKFQKNKTTTDDAKWVKKHKHVDTGGKTKATEENGRKRFKSSSSFSDDCDELKVQNSEDSINGSEAADLFDKDRKEENKGNLLMCLSLNAEEMVKTEFWPPNWKDTFTLSHKSDGSSNAQEDSNTTHTITMQDGTEVYTSWQKDKAIPEIKRIADLGQEIQKDDGQITETITPRSGPSIKVYQNSGFHHYVQYIMFLIITWPQKEDVHISIGKYVLRLQKKDFYVVPLYEYSDGHHQIIQFDERKLSYAKLRPTTDFSKKYSETLFNYIMGNQKKVSSFVRSPEDAIAVAAVLFSEVIRNPEMFFHNFVLMHLLKSWDDFHYKHPMLTGGSWKDKASRENPPKKVTQKTQKTLKSS
ncbi:uncharacterized protein si:dkey-211g8.8 [Astyanax mexicanus]|uniref:uncharacterized protein si:dkey-211g8.8 n=1 Tax=Astyanax mexicanus TaxID=7994 RepID=UPI0020CAF3BA|nr:uncharacterized protein si:dkey-211g8.8 [Astyanax mexicanus]